MIERRTGSRSEKGRQKTNSRATPRVRQRLCIDQKRSATFTLTIASTRAPAGVRDSNNADFRCVEFENDRKWKPIQQKSTKILFLRGSFQ
jgi:hypothetical protein